MRVLALAAAAALAAAVWPGPGGAVSAQSRAAAAGPAGRAVWARPGRPRRERRRGPGSATPHAVADALTLLSLALASGMGQREALERVALVVEGPVAEHLAAVVAALRWGRPSREAWAYAPSVWRPAALAWQVSEASGAAPAALVMDAAWRVREREDRRLEAAAARAGVRLVLPLGLAFLPAFACTAVVPVVLALAHTVLGP